MAEKRTFVCGRRAVLALVLWFSLVAACAPTSPPPGAGTAQPSGAPSGPPAGTSVVTVAGTTVQIVGTGNGTTDGFDLPAGDAQMSISTCASNQVIPFVTLYDVKDNKLGLIVDAEYAMRGLAGGAYYLAVAANPECVWTIAIVPG